MYLLDLEYVNAGLNGSGRFSLSRGSGTVGKWTLLAGDELHQELLRLTVLSCTSPAFFPGLSFPMGTLRGAQEGPLRVGNLRVLHEGVDTAPGKGMKVTGGVRVGGRGEVHSLSRAGRDSFFGDVAFRMHSIKAALCRDFILAYGSDFTAHEGDDDFDFLDPLFRCRRFRSLFSGSAPLTDPVAFLESLFHRGAKNKRRVPLQTLRKICGLLLKYFGLELHHWLESPGAAKEEWRGLPGEMHKPLLPVLDAVRHVLDAFPNRNGVLAPPWSHPPGPS